MACVRQELSRCAQESAYSANCLLEGFLVTLYCFANENPALCLALTLGNAVYTGRFLTHHSLPNEKRKGMSAGSRFLTLQTQASLRWGYKRFTALLFCSLPKQQVNSSTRQTLDRSFDKDKHQHLSLRAQSCPIYHSVSSHSQNLNPLLHPRCQQPLHLLLPLRPAVAQAKVAQATTPPARTSTHLPSPHPLNHH